MTSFDFIANCLLIDLETTRSQSLHHIGALMDKSNVTLKSNVYIVSTVYR